MKNPILTLLGSFGAGVPGSVTINFAPSGGDNCSKSCGLRSSICYAQTVESYKTNITKHLLQKQNNLTEYLTRLTSDVNASLAFRFSPWVRFSAFGSVPPMGRLNKQQRSLFRSLSAVLSRRPETTHLPVETLTKARQYAAMGFFPRLSLGWNYTPARIRKILAEGLTVSVVGGTRGDNTPGWTVRSIPEARAQRRRLQAQLPASKIIVCPKIAGSAKCGSCIACGSRGPKSADVVIYPAHK